MADAKTDMTIQADIKTALNMEVTAHGSTYVYDKDYEHLENKPSIESVTLTGNKDLQDLGITEISNQEIEDMLSKVFED